MLKTIIFTFFCSISFAQNLVENYSFEDISDCPSYLGQLNKAKGWFSPTSASPDLYSPCVLNIYNSIPSNIFGFQYPFFGDNYTGIGDLFNNEVTHLSYTEYISTQITRPLNKGETYNTPHF